MLHLLRNNRHSSAAIATVFATAMGAFSSRTIITGRAASIMGTEAMMSPKAHGTCPQPVQQKLRWGCDLRTADNICCFNRHYAEHSGYWEKTTFLDDAPKDMNKDREITFYDSVTGEALFVAPRGRTFEAFMKESLAHGWPSFRDEEVLTKFVRVLPNGEAVSLHGTHLGHNLPDRKGNRYCINLVSVAGYPKESLQPSSAL